MIQILSCLQKVVSPAIRPMKFGINYFPKTHRTRGFALIQTPEQASDAARKKTPRSKLILKTLRPELLITTGQPIVDFSERTKKNILDYRPTYYMDDYIHHPFPAGSKGFLYYNPGDTAVSGQVRLRICDSASEFNRGHDLRVNGMWPWAIHLAKIVTYPDLRRLRDFLLQEKLVTQTLIDEYRAFLLPYHTSWNRPPIYTLSEPFFIDISQQRFKIHLLSLGLYATYNLMLKHGFPEYGGILKVCFEMSTDPKHIKYGPTLIIKVLDVVKPVHPLVEKPKTEVLAIPGQYYQRTHHRALKPWHFPLGQYARSNTFTEFLKQTGSYTT
ncbi:hypothetical protein BDN70DRAFT_996459 [Pholiota conissans]|uniref:Uncharacterized protein n=1 Tax=Pholiota conissans TaxID=109636 RepID=A0A9P5YUG6_9AGAR|nr:hypothetical protein BDN70DRAFT_996459 [Pholiota conissans]